ncbi:MAG: copper resistance protein CopC [Gemmatimonadales bacterium]
MRIATPVRRSLSGALLAACALATMAAAATASTRRHTQLVKSQPSAHDTLTVAPKAIKLWFSEKVELKVTTVKLRNAAGSSLLLGAAARDDAEKNAPVVVPIVKPLAPGAYTIAWSAAAADGHPAKGTINFLVKGAP